MLLSGLNSPGESLCAHHKSFSACLCTGQPIFMLAAIVCKSISEVDTGQSVVWAVSVLYINVGTVDFYCRRLSGAAAGSATNCGLSWCDYAAGGETHTLSSVVSFRNRCL